MVFYPLKGRLFMKKPVRLAFVDGYKLLIEALTPWFESQKDLELVDTAQDGFGAVECVKKHDLDLMILEPMVPNKDGIDITKEIRSIDENLKLLILTADITPHNAYRMMKAGANGWVSKMEGLTDLALAIQTVISGKVYLPEKLQQDFAERYVHPAKNGQPEERLSDREFQVLRLLSMGLTNKEIAEKLYVGVKTIDTHRANLLKKLSLRNNADLTRFAIKNGLISLED
jgi:DNA-binding NarL/FixJ family response regulator